MATSVTIEPLRSTDPLSKSRFTKGLQCPTMLYFAVRTDAEPGDASPADRARFEIGNRVGTLACKRFELVHGMDACVAITADHLHQRDAVSDTLQAMVADKKAIFEAAFTHGRVKIRIDVLERVGEDLYDLIEVKSTGAYNKSKHQWDAAVQTWVARGAGVNIRRVKLMHLDKEYLWPGGEYDPRQLLTETDITDDVEQVLPEIPAQVKRLLRVLEADSIPAPLATSKCGSPYPCAFVEFCEFIEGGPEHPITEMPYCKPRNHVHKALVAAGIEELIDIDEETARQHLEREDQYWTWKATVDDTPYMLDSAEEFFGQLRYPLHFLDFETVGPALPMYAGTAPFEVVPVQYSIHTVRSEGAQPEHLEYIAQPGTTDPRRDLAEALLRDLGAEGTILEWHGNGGYESLRIASMAKLFPELADRLLDLNGRMLDLAALVRHSFFHKGFRGRYTIKLVLPALVPHMRQYSGMNIHDGDEAALALVEVLSNTSMEEATRSAMVRDLLDYCELDTEAMVEVWKVLVAHRDEYGCVSA